MPKFAVVYGYVSPADYERLKWIAKRDDLTMSKLIRAALNDYLEESGDAILADMQPVGRPSLVAD